MSGQDLTDFRLERLEKADEKKNEILQQILEKVAVMQTKFIIMGIVGSATVAGVVSFVFKFLGGK